MKPRVIKWQVIDCALLEADPVFPLSFRIRSDQRILVSLFLTLKYLS